MDLAVARLEAWMREHYHRVDHDIGSSGVRDLSLAELRGLCGFDLADLDRMVLHDSESHGGSALRAALADRWTGGDIDRMMVTHGSSEAIYLVMTLLLEPGDEIVVVEPAYQQLHDIAAGRGVRVVRWSLDGAHFGVDLDRLRALAACRPKMIVVNFPHNPTGRSISAAQQKELCAIADEAGAWLVWDHAFGELTYRADPLPLPIDAVERCIAWGTFSKSYGLAGLRVGWCVAPQDVLARMARLRDYIALYVSPVLEFFATHAVRNAERIVALQRDHARTNLALLTRWAEANPDLVRFTPPDGGVSAFLECRGGPDVVAVCRRLAREHRVLLVPGECFGEAHRHRVRLGFGGTTAELTAGLTHLEHVLRSATADRDGIPT